MFSSKSRVNYVAFAAILTICAYSLFCLYQRRQYFGITPGLGREPSYALEGENESISLPVAPQLNGSHSVLDPGSKTNHTESEDEMQIPTDEDTNTDTPNPFNQTLEVPANHTQIQETSKLEIDLVVAATSHESTTWMTEHLSDWNIKIYIADDGSANYTVPKNKGNEAMVYLTYIVDHYDSLPQYILFRHAKRFQWHSDDPNYDGLSLMKKFRFEHLEEQGYVNMRCDWSIGCPINIRPFEDEGQREESGRVTAIGLFKRAFEELFPEAELPAEVSQNCCAQFGATRDAIRTRKRSEYEHMRNWLLETQDTDDISGRVFEYSWHWIMGQPATFCPNASDCFCKLYGVCDLYCEFGRCLDQYVFPENAWLPEEWPYVTLEGEPRDWQDPYAVAD